MTDERIKELADKWCLHPTDNAWDEVMGFAYDLIAEERQACAKLCEEDESGHDSGGFYAEIIRARGEA
jgi:hypothetical protein